MQSRQIVRWVGGCWPGGAAGVAPSRGRPAECGDDVAQLPFGHGGLEDCGGFGEGERRIHLPIIGFTAPIVPPAAMNAQNGASGQMALMVTTSTTTTQNSPMPKVITISWRRNFSSLVM